jgi:hypothetical protein
VLLDEGEAEDEKPFKAEWGRVFLTFVIITDLVNSIMMK